MYQYLSNKYQIHFEIRDFILLLWNVFNEAEYPHAHKLCFYVHLIHCPTKDLIVLGDLREKSFKIEWPKGFFVQPAKTGTVTWEQLVAMFSPLHEL